MVCEGMTSRLEVTQELLRILGLEKKIKLTSVDSDFFQEEYFVKRPDSERLVNKKLNLRQMNIMRDWRISLKEYLEDYYEGFL